MVVAGYGICREYDKKGGGGGMLPVNKCCCSFAAGLRVMCCEIRTRGCDGNGRCVNHLQLFVLQVRHPTFFLLLLEERHIALATSDAIS